MRDAVIYMRYARLKECASALLCAFTQFSCAMLLRYGALPHMLERIRAVYAENALMAIYLTIIPDELNVYQNGHRYGTHRC